MILHKRTSWPHVIAHADMDAFYAAIEQLDDPSLRGRPVLVGHHSGRGVVLTASYEARPFGVGSAMPMAHARRRCPQAVIVPPRFERYQEISARIMRVFEDFSPRVETISLDEAFLDMSGSEHLFGDPEDMGRYIKRAVHEVTGGLTASVGLSSTKFVAKVASGWKKPDGLTVVPPEDVQAWLAPMPVSQLWGVGPRTEARLAELGYRVIGDVAAADPDWLSEALGRLGHRLFELAHGRDPRSVEPGRPALTIGSERTLEVDVFDRAELSFHLQRAADEVGRRLRRKGLTAGGVRVKLKTANFRVLTRQRQLVRPSDVAADLHEAAVSLLGEFRDPGPFRLVGLAAYALEGATGEPQMPLLGEGDDAKARRLETAMDRVAQRFGSGLLHRAGDLMRARPLGGGANLDYLRDPAQPHGPRGERDADGQPLDEDDEV